MNNYDILTLIIASWGAILSTVLLYREFQKDRRAILVFIDLIYLHDTYQLRVVNAKQRPITIAGVEVYLYLWERKRVFMEKKPLNKLLSHDEDYPVFPITLTDGEYKTFKLPENLNVLILKASRNKSQLKSSYFNNRLELSGELIDIELYVIDIEGRKYLAKKGYEFNPKFDQIIK